jgi:hypothetical protein
MWINECRSDLPVPLPSKIDIPCSLFDIRIVTSDQTVFNIVQSVDINSLFFAPQATFRILARPMYA